jgi:hypothetical protein
MDQRLENDCSILHKIHTAYLKPSLQRRNKMIPNPVTRKVVKELEVLIRIISFVPKRMPG